MKKKSLFKLLLAMVIVIFAGFGLTIALAVILGGNSNNLLDMSSMNFYNVGLVLIIGLFSLCLILAVFLLIFAKIGFENIADFIKNKKWED